MRFIIFRSLQVLAMVILISGLIWGIKEQNLSLELNALIIGSVLFYGANVFIKKSK